MQIVSTDAKGRCGAIPLGVSYKVRISSWNDAHIGIYECCGIRIFSASGSLINASVAGVYGPKCTVPILLIEGNRLNQRQRKKKTKKSETEQKPKE